MKSFSHRQLDCIDLLVKHFPSGISTDDPEIREVFGSIIDRGSGLVELVEVPTAPGGDAYRLTDVGAEAFRAEAEEQARGAELN